MPCRTTSWHVTSRVVQKSMFSSNRFTSIQGKTIPWIPKAYVPSQTFRVSFWHLKLPKKHWLSISRVLTRCWDSDGFQKHTCHRKLLGCHFDTWNCPKKHWPSISRVLTRCWDSDGFLMHTCHRRLLGCHFDTCNCLKNTDRAYQEFLHDVEIRIGFQKHTCHRKLLGCHFDTWNCLKKHWPSISRVLTRCWDSVKFNSTWRCIWRHRQVTVCYGNKWP